MSNTVVRVRRWRRRRPAFRRPPALGHFQRERIFLPSNISKPTWRIPNSPIGTEREERSLGVLHASHGPEDTRQAKGRGQPPWPRGASSARATRDDPPGPNLDSASIDYSPVPSPTPPRDAPMPHARPTPSSPVRSGWREPSANPRRAPSAAGIATPFDGVDDTRVVGHGDGILRKLRRALPDRPARGVFESRRPRTRRCSRRRPRAAPRDARVTARGDPRWRDPQTLRLQGQPQPWLICPA